MGQGRLAQRVRIAWTIASKDVLDSLKNRNTLGILASTLFVVVLYQFLPLLDEEALIPHAVVYDASGGFGQELVQALREQPNLQVRVAASPEELRLRLTEYDQVRLGLVLPAGADLEVGGGAPLTIEGYYVHWADPNEVRDLEATLAVKLSALTGGPVDIDTEGNVVYTTKDSESLPFLKSLTILVVLAVVGVSLVPNLVVEEKRTHTLEVLLLSPATAGQVVAGKALAGLFYAAIGVGLVLAFNARLVTQWWLAIVACTGGALFCVGLGLLVGSLVSNRQQLMIVVWAIITPLIILAVIAVMDEIFPGTLVAVAGWAPTSLVAVLVRASFSNNGAWSYFGPELAALTAYDLAVLGGVAWALRRSDR